MEWEYKIYAETIPGKCFAFRGDALDSSRELPLNEIGAEGWELINIIDNMLYFKRPLRIRESDEST